MIGTILASIALVALIAGSVSYCIGYFVKPVSDTLQAAGVLAILVGVSIVALIAMVWLVGGVFYEMYLK